MSVEYSSAEVAPSSPPETITTSSYCGTSACVGVGVSLEGLRLVDHDNGIALEGFDVTRQELGDFIAGVKAGVFSPTSTPER